MRSTNDTNKLAHQHVSDIPHQLIAVLKPHHLSILVSHEADRHSANLKHVSRDGLNLGTLTRRSFQMDHESVFRRADFCPFSNYVPVGACLLIAVCSKTLNTRRGGSINRRVRNLREKDARLNEELTIWGSTGRIYLTFLIKNTSEK